MASCALVAMAGWPLEARADAADEGWKLESAAIRSSAWSQTGQGYQSQAGPRQGPGSETLTVYQPQVELVVRQSKNLRHRVWIPVDIVTSASANAVDRDRVDAMSQASRQNEAVAIDVTSTHTTEGGAHVSLREGFHQEENYRALYVGLLGDTPLDAGAQTVLSANVLASFDELNYYGESGFRVGRAVRQTATLAAGLTRVLTETTVANVNYTFSLQHGELGNTFNIVPLDTGRVGPEVLPDRRLRHAVVARVIQWLPWAGSLRLHYRAYVDDWSLLAHTTEVTLAQRVFSSLVLRGWYRLHLQEPASFYTTRAADDGTRRTADSDLARFDATTLGGSVQVSLPSTLKDVLLELSLERYVRDTGLEATMVSFLSALRF